jgi:hypothetical protein
MVAPQACVAVEIAGPSAADEQRAALESRCSEILGARRCRIVVPGREADAACWHAVVTPPREEKPAEASVILRDDTEPAHVPVRRDITFRPNDLPSERWATLGLVIAALVTVEEHSAAEAAPPVKPASPDRAPTVVTVPAPAAPPVPIDAAVRASVVGALGLVPDAALGARVEVSAARGYVELLARGTIFPGDSRATLGADGAAGDMQLAMAGLGACGRVASEAWGARLCLAGDLQRLRARGVGVAETSAATDWSPSFSGVASLSRLLAAHIALTFEAELLTRLERPTFAIAGAPSVYQPSRVAGVAALGLAVPF